MATLYDSIIQKYNLNYNPNAPRIPGATTTLEPFVGPLKPDQPRPNIPVITVPKTYSAVVDKYTSQGLPNEYADVIASVKQNEINQRQAAQTQQFNDIQSKLENPGVKQKFLDFLSIFSPSNIASTVQNVKQTPHPISTGATAVGEGLLDFGPAVVNSASGMGLSLLSRITGMPPAGGNPKIPLPSELLNKDIARNQNQGSDLATALRTATTTTLGYEAGNQIVGSLGAQGSLARILGNVAGGQLTTEAESAKDRLKQAAFDTAFSVGLEAAGKLYKGVKAFKTAPAAEGEAGAVAAESTTVNEAAKANVEAAKAASPESFAAPAAKPEQSIVYMPKKNLGIDTTGEKVLAKTEFNVKDGRAIVYYDSKLDANPQLKTQVLDHEYGHVVDKRLNFNTNSNLSAELPNYQGNKVNLDAVLGDFANKSGKPVDQVVSELQKDIETLSKGNGSSAAEKFANAYAEYIKNPAEARNVAPTFSDLMNHQVQPATPIQTSFTTAESLKNPAQEVKPVAAAAESAPASEATSTIEKPKVIRQPSKFAGTGLDTGKTINTESFNPKSINAPAETEQLFKTLSEGQGNFATQRISKSNEDIKDLARIVGVKEEELIKAKPGSIANAETVTAARQLVLDKANDLMNYLKGIDVSTATEAQLKDLKDRFLKLVAMQKSVAGFRSEAAHVFRSFGIQLAPGENATLAELGKVLKEAGIASEGDAAVFAQKVAKEFNLTRGQKIGQGLLSTWYSAILSGPKTTVRNILSTSANILTDLASKAANPREWREIPSSVSGLFRGLKEGFSEAKAVFKGEATPTKFIDTSAATKPEIFTGKWKTYGQMVEVVGRFLNAQDRFLAAGAREMEKASLLARGAKLEPEISDAIGRAYAESTVYHGAPKGRLIGALRDAAQTLRTRYPEAKIVVPFVDTVANVLDRQFDYIPIFAYLRLSDANLGRQVARIAKDFNITSEADKAYLLTRLRDQQIGRAVLGTSVSAAAIALAADGRVSGAGPTNVNERNQLMLTGWRPNSVKIGNTWIPYANLGPLSGIFSMAGNVYDKTHYDGSPTKTLSALIAKGIIGWSQTQLNSSFLSGTADLLDVIKGNVSADTYIKNFLTGLIPIPAAYSQTKDMIFRQQYETHNIVEQIQQKLGLTSGLQPRLDQFGRQKTADLIYDVSPSKAVSDPVVDFLVKNQLIISKPSTSAQYSVPGSFKEKRQLTPAEYTQYVKESGQQIYDALSSQLEYLQSLSADDRQSAVTSIISTIRDQVRFNIMFK